MSQMTRVREKLYSARGRKEESSGFTLIELLVVVSVVGLVSAVTIPALVKAKQKGKDIINPGTIRRKEKILTIEGPARAKIN